MSNDQLQMPPAPPAPAPWTDLEDEVAEAMSAGPAAPPAPPSQVPPPPPVAQAPAAPPAPPVAQAPAAPPAPPVAQAPAAPPAPPVAQAPAAPPAPPVAQAPAAPPAPPAPAQTQNLPATAHASSTAVAQVGDVSVTQMASEEGFEGLDFDGFGTFPIISLKRGSFKTSSGEDLGPSFVCTITSSRPKYLYKTNVPDTDPRSDVAYTYDQQTSNGKNLQDILARWSQQGMGYVTKKYLELSCSLEDGRLMLISIPPTSISRFSAFTAARLMRGLRAADTLVRVYVGQEVTRVQFPFTPVEFAIVE